MEDKTINIFIRNRIIGQVENNEDVELHISLMGEPLSVQILDPNTNSFGPFSFPFMIMEQELMFTLVHGTDQGYIKSVDVRLLDLQEKGTVNVQLDVVSFDVVLGSIVGNDKEPDYQETVQGETDFEMEILKRLNSLSTPPSGETTADSPKEDNVEPTLPVVDNKAEYDIEPIVPQTGPSDEGAILDIPDSNLESNVPLEPTSEPTTNNLTVEKPEAINPYEQNTISPNNGYSMPPPPPPPAQESSANVPTPIVGTEQQQQQQQQQELYPTMGSNNTGTTVKTEATLNPMASVVPGGNEIPNYDSNMVLTGQYQEQNTALPTQGTNEFPNVSSPSIDDLSNFPTIDDNNSAQPMLSQQPQQQQTDIQYGNVSLNGPLAAPAPNIGFAPMAISLPGKVENPLAVMQNEKNLNQPIAYGQQYPQPSMPNQYQQTAQQAQMPQQTPQPVSQQLQQQQPTQPPQPQQYMPQPEQKYPPTYGYMQAKESIIANPYREQATQQQQQQQLAPQQMPLGYPQAIYNNYNYQGQPQGQEPQQGIPPMPPMLPVNRNPYGMPPQPMSSQPPAPRLPMGQYPQYPGQMPGPMVPLSMPQYGGYPSYPPYGGTYQYQFGQPGQVPPQQLPPPY